MTVRLSRLCAKMRGGWLKRKGAWIGLSVTSRVPSGHRGAGADPSADAHKDTACASGRPSPAASKEANEKPSHYRCEADFAASFTNVGRESVPPLTGRRLGVSI